MDKTIQSNRINYIDALRGFTMFLVVFGHVMLYSFNLGGYDSIIGSIFLTFRMPLFFFVAGIFSYKAIQYWNFKFYCNSIRKKILAQIVPTVFFATIFLICQNQNPIISLTKFGFGGFWFTIVLFEMFFIYYSVSLISNCTSSKICDLILIGLSILGITILVFFRQENWAWNFFCLENLVKYFQFFTFGILCKKYSSHFFKAINNHTFRGG
ncbi:MAG: acyltransferase family protein [Muribaculaceae bacterium]|nr:acyltransferase family protein [Muribaculaceae bacterium]